MQGDAPFRIAPEDLDRWYVRNATGDDGAVLRLRQRPAGPRARRSSSATTASPSMEIQGQPAPGKSSGAAMDEMEKLVGAAAARASATSGPACPTRSALSGAQAPLLYGLSMLVVFLLPGGALRELVDPARGDAGRCRWASSARCSRRRLRGLYNDVYFQVGLLTTIGLSAKNAILIVEFADGAQKRGDATRSRRRMEAARLRLRPILMTSLAFIAGVLPLAISTGAGAGEPERHRHRRDRRHAVGAPSWRSSSCRCSTRSSVPASA